jgi:MFS family permease
MGNQRYKWELLILLWVAFFINQADRQIFNVVLPLIRKDLHLTDIQVGVIAMVFNLVFALLVPVAGYISDRYSRKWIIVISILFWSVATMCTSFSTGMLSLLLFRSVATGGGEAFFGPANYSLLASYHRTTRATAMSLHQTALYIGIVVCGYLAGFTAERWGWEKTFLLFGFLGIIHGGVLIFRLKETPQHIASNNKNNKAELLTSFKILFGTPTALLLTIAFSGLIFGLNGYLTWTPTYLYEKFGLSLELAGFHSMFYTHLFALIGIVIAGPLSDRVAKKDPANRLKFQISGLWVAVPFILLFAFSETQVLIYLGLAGFGFSRAFFDANTYSVLYDVIPARYHSTASGMMMMTGFIVGSTSPLLLGYMRTYMSMSAGFFILAMVWLISGLLLLIAKKYYFRKDYVRL